MAGLLPELFTHRIDLDDAGGHADVFWPDRDIAESAKLERCVTDVKADDIDEPWAVCRAALGECKTDDCQCKGCRKLRECRIGKPKPGPCKKGLQGPPQPAVKTKPAKPVVKKLVDDDGIKLRDTFRRKMNQFLVVSRAGDDTAVEKARNDVEAVQNEIQVAFEDRMKRIKNWNVQVGYNKLIGDLSGGQQKAIVSYSNDAYKPINNALRRGKMSARQQELVGYLDAALDKGRLPEQMAVYRGMQSVKVFGKPPPKIGQMFSDAGFVSTSFDPDIANTFGSKKGAVLCELVLPKGTKGLSLEGSLGIAGEGEFLLPRGTNFKIAQAKMENNVWHIRAELRSGKQKKTLKEDVVDVVDVVDDYIETPEDTFKFMWRAEDIRLVNDDLAECRIGKPKPGPCKKGLQGPPQPPEKKKKVQATLFKSDKKKPTQDLHAWKAFANSKQINSLKRYVTPDVLDAGTKKEPHALINSALRSGNGKLSKANAFAIQQIQELFKDIPEFEKPITSYRGIVFSDQQAKTFLANVKRAKTTGKSMAMRGFISTSLSSEVAQGVATDTGRGAKELLLEIRVKKGIYLEGLHPDKTNEHELLLNHKSKFRVLSVDKGRVILEQI